MYKRQDQKTIVKNILKEQGINDKEFSAPYLLSIISDYKEKAVSADEYRDAVEDNYKTKVIYSVFKAYEDELKKNNACLLYTSRCV